MPLPQYCLFVGDRVKLTAAFMQTFSYQHHADPKRVKCLKERIRRLTGTIVYLKLPNFTRTCYAWVQWDETTGFTSPMINVKHLELVQSLPETIHVPEQFVQVKSV